MPRRHGWLVMLLLTVPALVATADPTALGAANHPVRSAIFITLAVAAVYGAIRHRPTAPSVGWLVSGVVVINAVNVVLRLDSLPLILTGFALGLAAIIKILATRTRWFRPGAGIDALFATSAPFSVIVLAATSEPLPADAPALLAANFVVLLLVIYTVALPDEVCLALAFGLSAIAVSTVGDVAALMHTPFAAAVARFLADLPMLLLAAATMHPTFAAISSARPLSDQRHRSVRVLVLSTSLTATLLLSFTDGRFIRASGVVLAVAPLALILLITLRIAEWMRRLNAIAGEERRRAQLDPVTGLLSKQGLQGFVEDRSGHQTDPVPWSMVAIDLDGFRRINDAFGSAGGDETLRAVGQTLRLVRPDDGALGRLTADEFAIVVPGGEPERLRELALAAVAALRELVDAGPSLGHLSLPASAGIAVDHDGGPDVIERLAGKALTAVGHAQRGPHGRVTNFDPRMSSNASADLVLLRGLQRALRGDSQEIQPALQPIIDLDSGQMVAVEALARWTPPQGGQIMPADFLALAEASGWIGALGQRMLRRSCEELTQLRRHNPTLRIQVNVSPVEAAQASFVQSTIATIQRASLPMDAIVLEVTEQVLMPAQSVALEAFLLLSRAGVGLALDDFGSGYASIGYLSRLPLDYVKVDKTFIAEIGSEGALLEGLLPFLAARGVTVIAEGVETEEQLARLKTLDCALAQGFLLGRPTSPDLLVADLDRIA